jgi:hypothetical protein
LVEASAAREASLSEQLSSAESRLTALSTQLGESEMSHEEA